MRGWIMPAAVFTITAGFTGGAPLIPLTAAIVSD